MGVTLWFTGAVWRKPRRATGRRDRLQAKGPAGEARPGMDRRFAGQLVQPAPGLSAAEHAAERAALNAQAIRTFQRDRRIVGAAGVGIENAPAPMRVLAGLHVDQNLFAVLVRLGVNRISAEIGAALLDPDFALFLLGQPDAKWRGQRRDCSGLLLLYRRRHR